MAKSQSSCAGEAPAEAVRIDKWLWAARFYKTRSLALDAIRLGQIECNGCKPKPSRPVRSGDELRIRRGSEQFTVIVQGVSERRGPAVEAQALYAETAASQQARELAAQTRRAQRLSAPVAPAARPDKHARQQIRRLLGR